MLPGIMPVVSGGAYKAKAVAFTTSDFLSRASAFAGISSNSTGTYSFWARIPSGDSSANSRWFFAWENGTPGTCSCALDDSGLFDNQLRLQGRSTSGNLYQLINISPALLAGPTWRHIAVCFKTGNIQVYVDGSLATSSTSVPLSGNYDWAGANDLHIARRGVSGSPAGNMAVELAEFWFDTSFVDLSIAGNMAKFRDSVTGKPVRLGGTGAVPTGAQPVVYLSGPAATINVNKGYGGDFVVNGAPTDAATSPSD